MSTTIKRRSFGLMAGTSMLAMGFGRTEKAQAAADPNLLKTTLTPLGSERAGNADGSIPAWDGGYQTIPAGWTSGQYMPDFFADEQPVLIINSSNMAQYADRLSEGTQAMMTKYGWSLQVYPTHRTACAPQWVYDNISQNVTRSALLPQGGRFGFTGGYGGIPFPIPDTSDPQVAGIQILWNHNARWRGWNLQAVPYALAVNSGHRVLASRANGYVQYNYYDRTKNVDTYEGLQYRERYDFIAPASENGGAVTDRVPTAPAINPLQTWVLLTGQGRVRKAPNLAFDTPDNYDDGVLNFDECEVAFSQSPEKYDWTYLGKKEFYIPYNNNGLILNSPDAVFGPQFLDPKQVRWELHRVWVIEATLHPSERNVLHRRRYYVDEDTWQIGVGDVYDANDTLVRTTQCFQLTRPDVPGTVNAWGSVVYDMQTGNYTTPTGWWDEKANPTIKFPDTLPDQLFEAQNMAASAQF